MNILYVIETSEPGGAESIVLSLAVGMRQLGHRCVIGLLEEGWLEQQARTNGFHTVMLKQRMAYDFGCVAQLCAIIRQFRINLVHAHEFTMNTYATMAGLLMARPVITTVHGKNHYWLKRRRRVAYRLVSRLTTMVAVSRDLARSLQSSVGIADRHLVTIYNGIDRRQYEGSTASTRRTIEAIKTTLGIPQRSLVIGTVGMLVYVKDHKTLLQAVAKVVADMENVVVLIVGEGELRNSLQEESERLGIERNVRLVGFRSDVRELLKIMDIYVCSSLSEGISLSILEAMAACRPVIATDVGGNSEIVIHGESGLLVAPRDPMTLASRIVLLLRDRRLAEQFGDNGCRRVSEEFCLERMINSYHDLYAKAIEARPRSSHVAGNSSDTSEPIAHKTIA